jgi:hypothetical protein
MPGDVEVQNASPTMGEDKEAVEHAKSDRRNREEIHRGDSFPVISKKGQPALG